MSKIEYCLTKDIDFTPCNKKKSFDCLPSAQLQEQGPEAQQVSVNAPVDDILVLFEILSRCGTKAAVVSLLPKYSDRFVCKSVLSRYPAPQTRVHGTVTYNELLNLCSSQEVSITKEQAELVERATSANLNQNFGSSIELAILQHLE